MAKRRGGGTGNKFGREGRRSRKRGRKGGTWKGPAAAEVENARSRDSQGARRLARLRLRVNALSRAVEKEKEQIASFREGPPPVKAEEPWMKLRGAARPAWVVQALERGENPYAVEDTRPVVNLLRRHKGRLGEHPDTRRYYRLCVALGCAHLEAGRSTRASHELVHALSLDSADTEGARFPLLLALVDSGELGVLNEVLKGIERGTTGPALAATAREAMEAADAAGGKPSKARRRGGPRDSDTESDSDSDSEGEGKDEGDGEGEGEGEGGGGNAGTGAPPQVPSAPSAPTALARALIEYLSWAVLEEEGASERRARAALSAAFSANPLAVVCIAAAPVLVDSVSAELVQEVQDAVKPTAAGCGIEAAQDGSSHVWWWQVPDGKSADAAVLYGAAEMSAWLDAPGGPTWVASTLPGLIVELSDWASAPLDRWLDAHDRGTALLGAVAPVVATFVEQWCAQRVHVAHVTFDSRTGAATVHDEVATGGGTTVPSAVAEKLVAALADAAQRGVEHAAEEVARKDADAAAATKRGRD